VMLDNMSGAYDALSVEQISFLCDRKLGVGADGLIKLSKKEGVDFYVDYFNADGSQSFCGNGGRCSVAFASELGLIKSTVKFGAIDGKHEASIVDGIVRLEMLPVAEIVRIGNDFFVETGSPHYVHFKEENDPGIIEFGSKIRYSERYINEGVNVNYLRELNKSLIQVETYERGVEDETLSCGTGVTACALVQMEKHPDVSMIMVNTKGGKLTVEAAKNESGGYSNIWLSGPAKRVFDGSVDV
jgi:diaminopimelate epimerase